MIAKPESCAGPDSELAAEVTAGRMLDAVKSTKVPPEPANSDAPTFWEWRRLTLEAANKRRCGRGVSLPFLAQTAVMVTSGGKVYELTDELCIVSRHDVEEMATENVPTLRADAIPEGFELLREASRVLHDGADAIRGYTGLDMKELAKDIDRLLKMAVC